MNIVVQKFGGTSLATDECRKQVVKKIIQAKESYEGIVVVVSAMGRLGLPYATDTLLSQVDSVEEHLSNREVDLLISCGEIISSVVISNLLQKEGIKAYALTGGEAGIITDDKYRQAEVIQTNPEKLLSLLKDGYVPVVAGFQGKTLNNNITTIGRGGSDTSAVIIGEAVGAKAVEIYTDVDGIMTADPRIYPNAKIIPHISYGEVFQMADSGAKVIHPRAVEVARRSGIPLIIKNTFNDSDGTNITEYNLVTKEQISKGIITSIAHRKDRIQFLVEGNIDDEKFFGELATKDVSIDIINIFPKRRVFTTDSDKKNIVLKVLKNYNCNYSYIDDCCKVTVIGERMTGVPGVMAKIIKSLTEVGVEILQTADSLSTIACLVKTHDLEKSIKALHKAFEL